ncbi:MAG: nickel pincer cofactor biosynthesis protein LarB [bacterium]|nr:nickel pincer cofactor biosynthesis protein LarB [bacterium]
MDKDRLKKLLESVKGGELEIEDALSKLEHLPYHDLGFARVDTHRALRRGFAETIFCSGKTTGQIAAIIEALPDGDSPVLATRASTEVYEAVNAIRPDATYYESARIILLGEMPEPRSNRVIAIISAGTSDQPVAEEAAVTAQAMGNCVERLYDVGVAGIHRLLDNQNKLQSAAVLVVIAGMDGVLPSVVGGVVSSPVIAVPTSVGYGASFDGLAALLTMLNSCSPGVAVVNIDNGFGAGYMAAVINRVGVE